MIRIHDFLQSAAQDEGDRVGWTIDSDDICFAAMDERSDRIAAGLLHRGVRHGDRIAINVPTSPDWLAVYFAAAKIGAVVVGLSVRYRENEFAHILGDSKARLVVTVPSSENVDFLALLESLRSRLPDLEVVVSIGGSGIGTLDELERLPADNDLLSKAKALVTEHDPVMIIYTSGTTGQPKGATLTHRSQLAAAIAQARHMRLTTSDVVPVAVPLNHVSGITCGALAALVARARVILLPTFTAGSAVNLLSSIEITIWSGVPTMHTLLLNHPGLRGVDTSSVRLVVTGGANADPALLERLTTAFPNATVMNLYGLSEVSGAAIMTPWDSDADATARAIGQPLPGVEAKIVDIDNVAVPVGQTGELLLQADSIMAGYHNMPTATAAVIDNAGWLHTGDMAWRDADGFITLRGRAKEMFIQGGFNIYPIEIENVLAEHPDVVLAAGIGVPDSVLGEIGRYYVTLTSDARVTESDLKDYCAGKIADYKVPKEIIITANLPMTPAGKVQKARLLDRDSG
ncbi:class I adenylate-forming enzyme family protein [Nocardia lijiangensis]|uniref:class I adenylate-forming enzyme family protein n=1 Tax=Nocardia lijiangensis TaxID=299618 RepID=UPI00083748FD|nr:AMP-binding protein [Nocardia lijiangensis]